MTKQIQKQGRKPNFIQRCNVAADSNKYEGKHQPQNVNPQAFNGDLQEKMDWLIAAVARSDDKEARYKALIELLKMTRTMANENRKAKWYMDQYNEAVGFLERMGCAVSEPIRQHNKELKKEIVVGEQVNLRRSLMSYKNMRDGVST